MVGGSTRGRKSRAPKRPGARGRGRPSATKDGRSKPPSIAECFLFRCTEVLDRLKKKDHYNIFLKPVNPDQVAGYRDVVKNPMDFSTMGKKLQEQQYKSLGEFRRDLDLIWSNCLFFNGAEPNNVFSKKAIELRKVTEKLIASTRSSLEKDKEELYRWKERHRRQRAERAGLVLGAPGGQSGSIQPGMSMSLALPGTQASDGPTLDSPLPPSSANPQQLSPEAAYEFALKQLLRVQYASNTGLHKKERQESLPQHYIAPDGSAVHIPSVRYNPNGHHWEDFDTPRRIPKRKLEMPNAAYSRLEPGLCQNSCHPGIPSSLVRVKDFVESVRSFVGNAGAIPNKIVDEFLAPELAVRDEQEKRKKRKLEARHSRPESQSLSAVLDSNSHTLTTSDAPNPPAHSGNVQKSTNGDPLMSSCKLSIFPKVSRKIAELDGEEGLAHLIGPQLTEEVKNIPVSVVDFAMPYGVNPETLTELIRLAMHPGLGLDPTHISALNEIRQNTVDIVAKMNSQIRTAHGDASLLSAQEIHEIQMNFSRQAEALSKSISLQQSQLNAQRRHEAQVLAESMRKRQQASIQVALNATGDQLPPIISASAQSMLPVEHQNPLIERRLQDQDAKSMARARNSVNSFQTSNTASTVSHGPSGGPSSTAAVIANVLGHTAPRPPPAASSSSALQNALMKITSGQMPPMRNAMHMENLSGTMHNHLGGPSTNSGTSGIRNRSAFNENGRGLLPNPYFGVSGGQNVKLGGQGASQRHNSTSNLPGGATRIPSSNVICSNCGTVCVQDWRLGGPSGKEQLCSTCGIYWERTKTHRPRAVRPDTGTTPRGIGQPLAASAPLQEATSGASALAPTPKRRHSQPQQPGTMRFAPATQNGGIRQLAMPAMHASLMNHVKNNTPVGSGGMSRGTPDQLPGLQVPLSGMMNSMAPAGSHHVSSQIGKEIDSFNLPELLGDGSAQRERGTSQENNVQKFSQMNSATPGPGGSQSMPNPLGNTPLVPGNNLQAQNAQITAPSNTQGLLLSRSQFNQNAQAGMDLTFGGRTQQRSAAPRSGASDIPGSNTFAGLPQFMTYNGGGLSRAPNTTGTSSSMGRGSVGRPLQGHALRPPPRDNMNSEFISSSDQQPNLCSDMSIPPLIPLPFGDPPRGNDGRPNHDEGDAPKSFGQNTGPQIDNLFSFGDGNGPSDFSF